MQRTGIGYDAHRLVSGRKLFLGGVEIPFEKGLEGHSDGDVVLHAVCDAILGAAGKGDIGEHFPNTDEKYRGVSSLKLLEEVSQVIRGEKMTVVNVDVMLIAESPNIKKYKNGMAQGIAKALDAGISAVNIKATTNEGMGFIGRNEGMAAFAAVSLQQCPDE